MSLHLRAVASAGKGGESGAVELCGAAVGAAAAVQHDVPHFAVAIHGLLLLLNSTVNKQRPHRRPLRFKRLLASPQTPFPFKFDTRGRRLP